MAIEFYELLQDIDLLLHIYEKKKCGLCFFLTSVWQSKAKIPPYSYLKTNTLHSIS